MLKIVNILVSARAPFILVGLLPFIFGSFHEFDPEAWSGSRFGLGLLILFLIVMSAGLADLYTGLRSGAALAYGYYRRPSSSAGDKFALIAAILCALLAALTVFGLARKMDNLMVMAGALVFLVLALSYAAKPLQLARHRLGELCVLLLLGPAPVMAGRYLQRGDLGGWKLALLSIPFGLLAVAVVLVHETANAQSDRSLRSKNLIQLAGPDQAMTLYLVATGSAYACLAFGVITGILNIWSLWCLLGILPAINVAGILKESRADKRKLTTALALAMAIQAMVGLILVADCVM